MDKPPINIDQLKALKIKHSSKYFDARRQYYQWLEDQFQKDLEELKKEGRKKQWLK